MNDNIAHIIPTYERPAVAQRLVNSIRRHYPDANIYICDDSKYPATYDKAVNIKSPAYDIGLSAKRNLLVRRTSEPYVFVWDDDYICTEDTSVELFYQLIQEVDELGIVGGNWTMGNKRTSWFAGWALPNGPIRKHVPPSETFISTPLGIDVARWHRVQFLPNWLLADRRTLQACPWDEELKLQEHIEFFTRLAALRAPYSKDERDQEWRRRYNKRSIGDIELVCDSNGRVPIFITTTLKNKRRFSDRKNGIVRRGNWVRVEYDYAMQLEKKGYGTTTVSTVGGRPFPLREVDNDVPLGVALLVNTTCIHDRRGVGTSEYYKEQRYQRSWRHLQFQKTGTSDVEMKQWHDYPNGSYDFTFDESLLDLPTNFEIHENDQGNNHVRK